MGFLRVPGRVRVETLHRGGLVHVRPGEGRHAPGDGGGVQETFTVRKSSFGTGVERTFPLHTPVIDHIELVSRGDVRRAKLYYLRDRRGKSARIVEKTNYRPLSDAKA